MCQCNGICVNKKAEDNLKKNHQEKKTTKTKPKWTKFSLVKLASNICTGFSSFRTFCHYLSDVRVVFGFRDRAAKMAQWFEYLCPRMWPGASCTPTRCRCSRLHWCRGRRPSLGLISCRTWQRSGLTYVRWWCFILWQHTCVRIWGNQTLPASGSLFCTCLVVELFRLLWGICTSSRSTSHFSRATCRKIGPLLRTLCVWVPAVNVLDKKHGPVWPQLLWKVAPGRYACQNGWYQMDLRIWFGICFVAGLCLKSNGMCHSRTATVMCLASASTWHIRLFSPWLNSVTYNIVKNCHRKLKMQYVCFVSIGTRFCCIKSAGLEHAIIGTNYQLCWHRLQGCYVYGLVLERHARLGYVCCLCLKVVNFHGHMLLRSERGNCGLGPGWLPPTVSHNSTGTASSSQTSRCQPLSYGWWDVSLCCWQESWQFE